MPDNPCNPQITFLQGDWVLDRNNPGQPGQYTGNWRNAGPYIMVELSLPGGNTRWRPLATLEAMPRNSSITERFRLGHFGRVRDLQRLITYEKLKGTLHE